MNLTGFLNIWILANWVKFEIVTNNTWAGLKKQRDVFTLKALQTRTLIYIYE